MHFGARAGLFLALVAAKHNCHAGRLRISGIDQGKIHILMGRKVRKDEP